MQNTRQYRVEGVQASANAYPTETKFTHDAPSTTRLRASVFDRGRTGVPPEGVELELGLVADLRREGLVAGYIEVGSTGELVGGYTFAGFDVAKNSDFRHGPLFSRWMRGEGA